MKAFVVSRTAFLSGGLALLSAGCSADKASPNIAGPEGSAAIAGTAAAPTAGVVQVCLDPASPAGGYHFALSGAANLQAGDVVAASPMAINNPGGPLCRNALSRTGSANATVSTIGVTASTSMTGAFSFVCADDAGGSSCNPASGVNNARAGENSYHGSTITFRFTAHVTPPAPPPPSPHPAPPPPPPPPSHPNPSVDAVFVIGDMTNHQVGATVYFWGSQWSKNNSMSGSVSNGIASFKGYAVSADATCGGTWTGRVGNSAKPPEALTGRITVIVTSSVNKSGPNISGNIVRILSVDHDGAYGPDPGNHGNGVVASINCGVGDTDR